MRGIFNNYVTMDELERKRKKKEVMDYIKDLGLLPNEKERLTCLIEELMALMKRSNSSS